MHDLVIRGGLVVDGSGGPARRADVAVADDRITAVGQIPDPGWRTLDASGCIVTPGFIDPHTHLDAQLLWDPLATPTCWHGTTTVVIGNCGVGFAPVRPAHRELLAHVLESVEGIPAASIEAAFTWRWERFGEYLRALSERPLGVHVAALVGHAPLRFYALGPESAEPDRRPDAAELALMQELLDEALEAGALGVSTSRTRSHTTPEGVPIPGSFAPVEELEALASVLARRGRGLTQWVAGFGEEDRSDAYPEARREVGRMARVAEVSRRPVVFSVFTHALVPTLHRVVLTEADALAAPGVRLRPMFNGRVVLSFLGLGSRSPFRASSWRDLYALPLAERRRALEDPGVREKLLRVREEAEARAARELFLFGPERCEYELAPERRLDRIAAARGERPVETVIRLFRKTGGRQLFAVATSNQVAGHVEEVLARPDVLLGLGDAGAHVTDICDASLPTWHLARGCRDRGRWTLEEIVRKLTAEPAEAFGLRDRGRLAPGLAADLNVIDLEALDLELPEFVFDFPAGAGRFTQRARGNRYTVVGGAVAVEEGRHTGALAGRLLRA